MKKKKCCLKNKKKILEKPQLKSIFHIKLMIWQKKCKFVVNGTKCYSPVKRFQNSEGLLIEHIAPSRIFESCILSLS